MKIGIAAPISLDQLNLEIPENCFPKESHYLESPLIAHIVNGLLKRGHKIIVYSYAFRLKRPIIYKTDRITICISRAKNQTGRRFFKYEINDMAKLMIENPADIIHAHWSYEFAKAALKTNIPTLVQVHDYATAILKYHFDMYRIVRWVMNYQVLKKAKYLGVVSPYILNHVDQSKARIIPNFYDNKLEEYGGAKSDKSDYIISVANGFDRRKNIQNALFAFSLLRLKFPHFKFHLIGKDMQIDGPAHRFAKKHNIHDNVVFWGPQKYSEVLSQIQEARIYLHTSREESFGLSVLEAMVLGTPVVGGRDSGNVSVLLENGKSGAVCNINSPKEIAGEMCKILYDKEYAETITKSAQYTAKNNYSEDLFYTKLLDYYKYIIDKEGKSCLKNMTLAMV